MLCKIRPLLSRYVQPQQCLRGFSAKPQYVRTSNPFQHNQKMMYQQNMYQGGGDYSGFTGNIPGGPTSRGPGGGGSNVGGGTDDKNHVASPELQEFYKLPLLSKVDQVEIVTELTKGSEINMTPSLLVQTLNDFIISQIKAKKIVSQAIRNKYRMRQVEDAELRKAMRPSNILVSGKSGSGKTEIFRQISRIYNAPFIRVEATKYTEVGYHGEDVTSIISDLFKKTQQELLNKEAVEIFNNSKRLKSIIHEHILKMLMGPGYKKSSQYEEKAEQLENGDLDESYCYLYVPSDVTTFGAQAANSVNQSAHSFNNGRQNDYNDGQMTFSHLKVKEIKNYMYEIYAEELFKIIDVEEFVKSEIENKGIVVIDEIDKLVRAQDSGSSTKASDEGVQYDLLPILDGTTVSVGTKLKLNTRNILFVGAGAFEKAKPTELAIELQGRLPINAKMESLTKDDFVSILKNTKHNLLVQSIALLKTEDVNLVYEEDAIDLMAQISVELNEEDNIGARRLRTVVDAVLEEINFEAPDFEQKGAYILIGKEYVEERTKHLYQNRDYKKYIM